MTDIPESTAGVRRLSLRKNFSWALVGNFLYAFCQLSILFVIQALGSLEKVGSYSLALALCVPVYLLTNLQLRTLQTTDANRDYHFSDYAGVRAVMTPLAVLALALVCGFGHYSSETAGVILAMTISKAIETASELCYGAFQQHERLDYVSRSLCLKGLTSLTIIAATLAVSGSLILALLLVAVGWFLIFLLHDFRHVYLLFREEQEQSEPKTKARFADLWMELRPRWKGPAIRQIVLCGLPLGLSGLFLSATDSLPNIFIEWKFGERELGIFTLLMTVTFAGLPIVNALGQAVTPRLARNYADRNVVGFQQVLLKAVVLGCLFGLALVVGTLLLGEWVLTLCFGPEVAEYSSLLYTLMILAPFRYGFRFFGNGLAATRRFALILKLQIVGLALLVISIAPLAAVGGLIGVAGAICLTAITASLLFAWWTRRELKQIAERPEEVRFLAGTVAAARSLLADARQLIDRVWEKLNRPRPLERGETFTPGSDLTQVTSVKR